MIAAETIEAVKEKARLLEVASEYIDFKRQGNRYLGLCPFHNEKTPSFHVRPDENTYHCFGCGVSGNVISFIMELRGLSFPEAIEELAGRYNIPIQMEKGRPSAGISTHSLKKDLYQLNSMAAAFFMKSLKSAPREVHEYVKARGLTMDAIMTFGVGFAPAGRASLWEFLKSKKTAEDLVFQSGLARRNDRGEAYDTFRARLMFPICTDPRRVVAFGGRLVPALSRADQNLPKYINSPETPIYEKNKTLFALPQARAALRGSNELLVVEGYMDVISLWQVGVRNSVATCGTALTPGHIDRLVRLTRKVTVLFDGDAAGRAAAAKCFPLFLNAGAEVRVVFLEPEDDPDTVARRMKEGTAAYISGLPRLELLDCYIDSLKAKFGINASGSEGDLAAGEIAREVAEALKGSRDPIVRDRLTQRAAFLLRVNISRLAALVEGGGEDQRKTEMEISQPAAVQPTQGTHDSGTEAIVPADQLSRLDQELLTAVMAQREVLCSRLLHDPELVENVHPSVLLFGQTLFAAMAQSEEVQKDEIRRMLHRFGPTWIELWKRAYEMSGRVNMQAVFEDCCAGFRRNSIARNIQRIKDRLKSPESEEEKVSLTEELVAYSRRLH